MPPLEQITPMYRVAMAACTPAVRWWGRMSVEGLEHLPEQGPVLLAGNHDSYWDPVAVGIAGLSRRQVRALAKVELWKVPLLGPILNGMGQIPIHRGKGDVGAMDRAVEELQRGACIGVFPEGTRSQGQTLRARSGFGRLAEAVPEAEIVCVSIRGTVDITRFPTPRPDVQLRFFRPAEGGLQAGESHADFGQRLVDEIRAEAPRQAAGRTKKAAAREAKARDQAVAPAEQTPVGAPPA